eukprot:550573-Ditylum_brightwellii.AAC.1
MNFIMLLHLLLCSAAALPTAVLLLVAVMPDAAVASYDVGQLQLAVESRFSCLSTALAPASSALQNFLMH